MTDSGGWLGSKPLADALASADVPALGRALRLDYVLLPQLELADGSTQVRVFPSPDPQRPYRLHLFSSEEAVRSFFDPVEEEYRFAVVLGRSLAGFLDQYMAQLELVAFDPGGPHPMTASPQDVRAILEPQADDDEVAWVAGDHAGPPSMTAVGLDVALPSWTAVDPVDREATARAIQELLATYSTMIPGSRRQRAAVPRWAERAVEQAQGLRLLAFRVAPMRRAGVGFAAFHTRFLSVDGGFEALEATLGAGLQRGEQLSEVSGTAGRMLRHRHVDGDDQYIDYWAQPPAGNEWPRLRFSTPQAAFADQLLEIAEPIATAARFAEE